jgi:hypothetical protein
MRPHSPALRQMLRLALVAPLWGLISSRRRPSPGEAQAPSTPVALAPTPMDRALPDWRGVTLRANRWRTEAFNPSYWSEPKLGPYAWSLRNAVIKNGVLRLKVTEKASSQIQAWDRRWRLA